MHQNTLPSFPLLHSPFTMVSAELLKPGTRGTTLKYKQNKKKQKDGTGRLQLNPVPQTVDNVHNTLFLVTKVLHIK